jgi:Ulp1 family protease
LKSTLPEIELKDGGVHPILFMNPSAAWMVSMIDSPEELEMCLDQLSLGSRDFILIPVNDSQDPSKVGGGSHWSLLLFHRPSNAFFYFDSVSSGSNNKSHALSYVKNIYPVLHIEAKDQAAFKVVKAPSQKNGFDCGVYVISFSNFLLKWITTHGLNAPIDLPALEASLEAQVSQTTVTKQRKALLELVDMLTPGK